MAEINGLLSVRMIDQYGIPGTTDYFIQIDDTKTIEQLATDGLDLSNAEAAISAANVIEVWARVPCFISGDPVAGSGDIEKGGLFNFTNATDGYATGVWVPDINPSVLNGAGLIDLANTDVAAFVTFLTTAHTAITVVTKGVRALTALKDALISFRKHRKPLARKTKEI